MKLSKIAQLSALISVTSFTLLSANSVWANQQDKQFKQVVKAGEAINKSAQHSQQKIDKYSEQTESKLQQFKSVNKEIDGLKIYNQQMQSQIDNQLEELAQIADSMQQVSVIERQVSPLMQRMIDTLSAFVSLDVPFLPQERSQRLANLKQMMSRADVAVSEKFRRVLEAYQVEVDYGRTIEAYTGELNVNGKARDVDFLRIGRVALVYQTRDGSQLGLWDQNTKQWQPLDDSYRLDINKAMRIARKQLAPDMIVIPVTEPKTTAE